MEELSKTVTEFTAMYDFPGTSEGKCASQKYHTFMNVNTVVHTNSEEVSNQSAVATVIIRIMNTLLNGYLLLIFITYLRRPRETVCFVDPRSPATTAVEGPQNTLLSRSLS